MRVRLTGLLCLVCSIAAAQRTESVLHNFGSPPNGGSPATSVIRDGKGNLFGTTEYGGEHGMGVVYKIDASGNQTVLDSFSGTDGANPLAGVIGDSAGNLYGTTVTGGAANMGTVYEVSAAGVETVLYSFTGGTDGANPFAGVVRDSAGNLYGTTTSGSHGGVVYKVDASGHETVLYTFANYSDGQLPSAGVIRDSAGNLYGTTQYGGAAGAGVIYTIDTAGTESILYNFTGGSSGAAGYASLTRDSAGNLYGTGTGGAAGRGVVYKLVPGGPYTILYAFEGGADGGNPEWAGVLRDAAGNLYGTTIFGGTANQGTVYKIDSACDETVLHSFAGGGDGAEPYAGVIRDSSGNLYGTALLGGRSNEGLVFKISHSGQKTNVYGFPAMKDGANPSSGLTGDSSGNFYGTTYNGGLNNLGTVYKVTREGKETVLHWFTGVADGANPRGNLARDSQGNLYGTTVLGGPNNAGTVFKLDANGGVSLLYAFTGGADGANPEGGVVLDPAGNLYGTTYYGGAWGWGAVFELDPAGNATVLYSFTGNTDGGFPYAGLVRDSSGALYGTTEYGGYYGAGVVFVAGQGGETPLYSFRDSIDGAYPVAGVTLDASGNVYGTTPYAGAYLGVVFKVDPAGQESVLYDFVAGSGGVSPHAGVILDAAGNLYGTTTTGSGGAYAGVVYEVSPSGQETVLYSFTGGSDGGQPSTGLLRDAAGNLYGTTQYGGLRGTGVVFEVRP